VDRDLLPAPRWVRSITLLIVCGFAVISLAWWRVATVTDRAARERCEFAVHDRTDNRAMWIYVAELYEKRQSPEVVAFMVELNQRLPVLSCVDGNLVPRD